MVLLPEASEPADGSWEMDERTRELGRRGLAEARQALRQAAAPLAA